MADHAQIATLKDNEIRVNINAIKSTFGFVGDGIDYIDYDLASNHVWVNFHPNPAGYIDDSHWNRVKDILNFKINSSELDVLEGYTITFRLNLYFDDHFKLGIY